MNEEVIKKELLDLLASKNAHMDFYAATADFPIDRINEKFPKGSYSSYGLIEHIRRTQKDILDFCINPNYKELAWPKDYWPDPEFKATEKDWNKTIENFMKDMAELEDLVKNPKIDFYSKIPWGDGQVIFREVMMVADHNAYHVGELAIMRQVMGTWNKGHE